MPVNGECIAVENALARRPGACEIAACSRIPSPSRPELAVAAMSSSSSPVLKAVILAAGYGSRLRPATDDRPKALLELAEGGPTILDRLAAQCAAVGCSELVIVTGYCADAVERWLAGRSLPLRATTVYNPDYATMNNAQSLYVARPHVEGASFLKFDGDLVLDDGILPRLVAVAAGTSAIVLDDGAELTDEDMKANVDGEGRVLALGKGLDNATASGISIGIERIDARDAEVVFEAIRAMVHVEGFTSGYYEDAYQRVLGRGLELSSVTTGGLRWLEIDTPEELAEGRALHAALQSAG